MDGTPSHATLRTALFVGSFDPFTVGHASIVARALAICDRLVIGIGVNEQKQYTLSAAEREEKIRRLYAGEPRITVKAYTGMTVDFARSEHASFLIKGIRTADDLEYERRQAEVNRQSGGIETVFLIAEHRYSHVSSSLVRRLQSEGKDAGDLLPTQK